MDNRNPEEGLKRLSASAALIMVALVGQLDQELVKFSAPELRVTCSGEIEAWIIYDNERSVDLFEAWPNKFARLAFGFACDHFKMLYPEFWVIVSEAAQKKGKPIVFEANQFDLGPKIKLEKAQPERITAPALMEMCKRMATPGWITQALEDLEHGNSCHPPPLNTKRPKTGI